MNKHLIISELRYDPNSSPEQGNVTLKSTTKVYENNITTIEENISTSKLFNELEEIASQFLKLPQNKRENTEARNKIIIELYQLFNKHYPDITKHTSAIIIGYIATHIGLLDTEEQYAQSKNITPYQQYLRTSVLNSLKSKIPIN